MKKKILSLVIIIVIIVKISNFFLLRLHCIIYIYTHRILYNTSNSKENKLLAFWASHQFLAYNSQLYLQYYCHSKICWVALVTAVYHANCNSLRKLRFNVRNTNLLACEILPKSIYCAKEHYSVAKHVLPLQFVMTVCKLASFWQYMYIIFILIMLIIVK